MQVLSGDVIPEVVSQGMRVGYVAFVVGGARIGRTWNVVMVARLSRGALSVLVEHILPWMAGVGSLSREELSESLAKRRCPWGPYSNMGDWHEAGLIVAGAIQQRCFAQSRCCSCSVLSTCRECLSNEVESSQFRCKYTMGTAGMRICRDSDAHRRGTDMWSERIVSFCN